MLAAPGLAAELEACVGATLDELFVPAGRAVAELFGHTAVVAGVPENVGSLRRVGDAYGRLVHLLDAVRDRADDDRAGRFNPLTATGTTTSEAHQLARRLTQQVAEGMAGARMIDPDLAEVLLGPELERAVSRTFRSGSPHLAVAGVLTAVALFGFPRRQRRRRERDGSRCGDFADCCCPCDGGDCGVLDCLAWDCMDCCDCVVCDCC